MNKIKAMISKILEKEGKVYINKTGFFHRNFLVNKTDSTKIGR